jgi:hypothetical protein
VAKSGAAISAKRSPNQGAVQSALLSGETHADLQTVNLRNGSASRAFDRLASNKSKVRFATCMATRSASLCQIDWWRRFKN